VIGKTISHYQIIEKLGEGGMGDVYKARDLALDRIVALKFLKPHIDDDDSARKRFINEAKTASALDHRNVATIYEIGQLDERGTFIAMAFYGGTSLADEIGRGPLEWTRALDTAIQVAEGLAEAHRHDIIHRDIKPANVIITERGEAKILDFGLAKLTGQTRLTHTGTTMGTIGYMSPEQAEGAEVDRRADIWALGALLYESLVGKPPFTGSHGLAVLYATVNLDPEPVTAQRAGLPPGIDGVIAKALAKRPSERYQNMDDMLVDLRALRAGARSTRTVEQSHPSIAVLYLENLSQADENDFFRDGITEDITTELAKIENLQVFPRAAVVPFRDQAVPVAEVSRQLNASHIVSGSIRRAGERLRVNLQLVHAQSGHVAWAERYDRAVHDIFDVQEDIARNVAQALRISLSAHELHKISEKPTVNLEAYDFYLRGRSYTRRQNRSQALDMFQRAIALEPDFARAHAGVANMSAMHFYLEDRNPLWIDRAEAAVNRAFALAPQLPEGFVALARIRYAQKRYPDAATAARAAIAIKADCESAWDLLGRALFASDQWEDAASLVDQAIAANGDDYNVYVPYINVLQSLGRDATNLHRRMLVVLERQVVSVPEDTRARILLAGSYVFFGRHAEAAAQVDQALAIGISDPHSLFNIGCVYAQAGDKKRALDALKSAAAAGYGEWSAAERDPDLASLRDDPEFQRWLEEGRSRG
jgi:serine/threonine protein kinase/Flp pilus assembly protein TadD